MDFASDLLPWIIGMGVVIALLGGSGVQLCGAEAGANRIGAMREGNAETLARGFRARPYRVAWFESPTAMVCWPMSSA